MLGENTLNEEGWGVMLEGVVLDEATAYLHRVIPKVSALNHYIRQHPEFVKNEWTECAERCVAGWYTYHGVDQTGRGVYKPKAATVEHSLRFIALDVKSNVLQMQREIAGTIYEGDRWVHEKLQELVDLIDEGFVYFIAGSAREYVGYVQEKLAKLYERVRGGLENKWWPRRLKQSGDSVNTLMESVSEGDTTKATRAKVLDDIAQKVEPTLIVLRDNMHGTEYYTADNAKLLQSILDYIDRGIKHGWIAPTTRSSGASTVTTQPKQMQINDLLDQLHQLRSI